MLWRQSSQRQQLKDSHSHCEALALVIDHGLHRTILTGGPLESGVGVFFAGDSVKADDVIVDIVQERSQSLPPSLPIYGEGEEKTYASSSSSRYRNLTTIVTADSELIRRCQYAAKGKPSSPTNCRLTILDPKRLLDQLEQITSHASGYLRFMPPFLPASKSTATETPENVVTHPETEMDSSLTLPSKAEDTEPAPSSAVSLATDQMLQQVTVRQELLSLYQQLNPRGKGGKRAGVARNKRIKLQARLHKTRHRLASVLEFSLLSKEKQDTIVVKAGDHNNNNIKNNNNNLAEGGDDDGYDNNKFLDQVAEELIARKRLFTTTTSESTWEREILSQRLQRQLEQQSGTTASQDMTILFQSLQEPPSLPNANNVIAGSNYILDYLIREQGDSAASLPPPPQVIAVPRQRNGEGLGDDDENSLPPLRIVAISDTHGFEDQLSQYATSSSSSLDQEDVSSSGTMAQPPPPYFLLPEADVLIHCGDFYGRGHRSNKSLCMKHLDQLLAAQSHIPTKIVVRGNHDPLSPSKVLFPRSGALYATKPMTLTIKGAVIVLMPFSHRTSPSFQVPRCDVFVSHEPPFGILDKTYQNKHAGSVLLRHVMERAKFKPSLWLCGHIHEARGTFIHTFQKSEATTFLTTDNNNNNSDNIPTSTVVVNAANANWGRANRLVAGPFVISLGDDNHQHESPPLDITNQPTSRGTPLYQQEAKAARLVRPDSLALLRSNVLSEGDDDGNEKRRLLAVDLGLRTAAAVFDHQGSFLSTEQFHFGDIVALEKSIPHLIVSNNITHIVVEGEDVNLYDVWTRSIEALRVNGNSVNKCPNLPLARITASEWRQELLLPKEQKSSRLAKVAAGHIARQVVGDKFDGKMSTDAAEAILAGHYALRVLGWSDSSLPLVQRYSNGDVIRDRWSRSRQRFNNG